MNLYLVKLPGSHSYDEYDSFVCCAENENLARRIHPDNDESAWDDYTWVKQSETDKLKVTYLGVAEKGIQKGVICASFNAG